METFRTESLTINGTFQATFIPDFQKRKRNPIKFTYISFLNVTSETEDSALTRFVEEHVTVAGRPRYSMKNMPLLNTSLSLVCIEYSISSKIFPDSISYSAYPSNARTQDNQIYITLEPTTPLQITNTTNQKLIRKGNQTDDQTKTRNEKIMKTKIKTQKHKTFKQAINQIKNEINTGSKTK